MNGFPECVGTAHMPLRVMGLPLGRRMTWVRRADGKVVLFSPLSEGHPAFAEVDQQGPVTALVVPNHFHDRFYPEAFRRYPRASRWATEGVVRSHSEWALGRLEGSAELGQEFAWVTLAGCPRIEETVFFHRPSRTLIFADLVFPLVGPWGLGSRLLLRAAGIGPRLGPSRLYRSLIADRRAFAQTLDHVLAWDFRVALGGHGEPLVDDPRGRLREAFREYLVG